MIGRQTPITITSNPKKWTNMQQHPREAIAAQAEAEMTTAIAAIVERHELTCGEVLAALAAIQVRWAKYQVRDERTDTN